MLNDEVTIHPQLQHVGLVTGAFDRMADWYTKVVGTRPVHVTDHPLGEDADLKLRAGWFTNDAAHHRIAIIEIPGATFDTERARHTHLQHIAFEYRTLDDLLGTYLRLKALAILPARAVDQGGQTALYYEDPDRNTVELNVSNFGDFGDNWTSIDHMRTSPEFARRPIGVDIDPDRVVEARKAGASPWDIHKGAWANEFAPATPYDHQATL